MEIKLKTLTPIWTGGVETGQMERLHETGLIGSLRWWYEAIVRGLGGDACDPTTHACIYNPEKPDNGLCDACQLFGATGWRRRFQVVVDDADLQETWSGGAVINVKPPDRNRGWYLSSGKMGTFYLRIVADERTQAQILALIQFIARWGSLGARPQLGYGLVEITDVKNPPSSTYSWDDIGHTQPAGSFPDLRVFTFFSLNFEPQEDSWWRNVRGIGALVRDNRSPSAIDGLTRHHIMPTTPALKNVLRYGQTWSSGSLPHQFFGTLSGDQRIRSKIALSWAYQLPHSSTWQIRGWAYPPQVGDNQRQEIQQRLQAVLGKPETWLRALNVRYRSAELSLAPTNVIFQPGTRAEVKIFIQEAAAAEVTI